MGRIEPNDQQLAAVGGFESGANAVWEAGAGAGKTTTAKAAAFRHAVARISGNYAGHYLSFNSSAAKAARPGFPRNVRCTTIHSLGWQVGKEYADLNRVPGLGAPRQPAFKVAEMLGIRHSIPGDAGLIAPKVQARIVLDTVKKFCEGIEPEITAGHVPFQKTLSDEANDALKPVIVPLARKAWQLMCDLDSKLNVPHDAYLKMWWLAGDIRIPAEFVILDEAQDSNPLAAAIVLAQADHAQLVAVGDSCQQLYGWRGAVDALATWPAEQKFFLTKSYRYGPELAYEANKWLSVLDAELRVEGASPTPTLMTELDAPDAVLCRTNSQAMAEVIAALAAERKTALAGGDANMKWFIEDALRLKAGEGGASHPDLFGFASWANLQDFVDNEPDGGDLRPLVDMVESHEPEELTHVVDALVSADEADVMVSTVHKAKGAEWGTVRIAPDFRAPGRDRDGKLKPIPKDVAMCAYVAVTRGRKAVDRGGLAWIDDYMPAPMPTRPRPLATPQRRAVVTATATATATLTISHADLEAWARRPLSDAEVAEVGRRLASSSVPDAFGELVALMDLGRSA
jgi:superfamily I DNA/RNA helicase